MSKKNRNVTENSVASMSDVGAPEPTANVGARKSYDDYVFTSTRSGGFGAAKFPWDQLFDGKTHVLAHSSVAEQARNAELPIEDDVLDGKLAYYPYKIRKAGKRRYKFVELNGWDVLGEHKAPTSKATGFIIRARDMMADERITEDARRAAYKAKHGKDETDDDTEELSAEELAEAESAS